MGECVASVNEMVHHQPRPGLPASIIACPDLTPSQSQSSALAVIQGESKGERSGFITR